MAHIFTVTNSQGAQKLFASAGSADREAWAETVKLLLREKVPILTIENLSAGKIPWHQALRDAGFPDYIILRTAEVLP
jgi:hypothetical protein